MSTNLLPLWLASPSDVANVIPVHRLTKECRACAATAVQHGRKKPLGHGQLSSETFTSATCLMPHHLEGVKMCWLNHSYSNSTGWMVRHTNDLWSPMVIESFTGSHGWTGLQRVLDFGLIQVTHLIGQFGGRSSESTICIQDESWSLYKFIRAWRMMKLHRPWLRHRLSL